MQIDIIKYILDLRNNAKKYEHLDINGDPITNKLRKHFRLYFTSVISFTICLIVPLGFSSSFINHTSSILSILVGLLISVLIFSFDKFANHPKPIDDMYEINLDKKSKSKNYKITISSIKPLSSKENLRRKRAKNFLLQFTYSIGLSILLSILVIILLTTHLLIPPEYQPGNFSFSTENIKAEELINFLKLLVVFIYRLFTVFLLLNILYWVTYAIVNMVTFIGLNSE